MYPQQIFHWISDAEEASAGGATFEKRSPIDDRVVAKAKRQERAASSLERDQLLGLPHHGGVATKMERIAVRRLDDMHSVRPNELREFGPAGSLRPVEGRELAEQVQRR